VLTAFPSEHFIGCHIAVKERTTKEHVENRSGKGYVDSVIQVEGLRKMETASVAYVPPMESDSAQVRIKSPVNPT